MATSPPILTLTLLSFLLLFLSFPNPSDARSPIHRRTDRRIIPQSYGQSRSKDAGIVFPSRLQQSDLGTEANQIRSDAQPLEIRPLPLTLLNFRPINRRSPRIHSKRLSRGCRHLNRRFRPTKTTFSVLRYGDDMILSDEMIRAMPVAYRPNRGAQKPQDVGDGLRFGTEERRRQASRRRRRARGGEGKEGREEGGLLKRIRKFLSQF